VRRTDCEGGQSMSDMRRREFVTLLGGAAAALPLAARAQQPGKLPTIGFLGTPHLQRSANGLPLFCTDCANSVWTEGRTITIEFRWAEGRSERVPAASRRAMSR
jgi:hypothetical protein